MTLEKIKRGFYFIILITVGTLLLLGGWWLYLVFKLANKLDQLNHPLLEGNLIRMVKWEGATFIILLITLTIILVYIYIQDHKKTISLQAFFASLTHELKTPLASIKLQTEVLTDIISKVQISPQERERINTYTTRLIDDSIRLEDELDNHLQLSRIERGAVLNLRKIELVSFIKKEQKRYEHLMQFEAIEDEKHIYILADDFALETVLRNLFENSIKHCKTKPVIGRFSFVESPKETQLIYQDNGPPFSGELNKLGTLFYKHESPQGSGIGVYLIHKIMQKMKGELSIKHGPNFISILSFAKGEHSDDE